MTVQAYCAVTSLENCIKQYRALLCLLLLLEIMHESLLVLIKLVRINLGLVGKCDLFGNHPGF